MRCVQYAIPSSLILATVLTLAGCGPKKPITYRLAPQGRVLLPPGVVEPELAEAKMEVQVVKWQPACAPEGDAITVTPGKKKRTVMLTISRAALLKQPVGWISEWTATAEAQGCLAPQSSVLLAMRVVESVPIEPSVAYRLLHADNVSKGYIDLGPQNQLQVVSPVLKEGTPADAPLLETTSTTGSDHQMTVTVKSSSNLIGYETAWYEFQLKPNGAGSTIRALGAEKTIMGKKEPEDQPATNWFQFPAEAGYYRMFYKTDPKDSGITEIVVAAATSGELETLTRAMRADNATCEKSGTKMCVVVPRQVAVNPFLHATVNGVDKRLNLGSSVRLAILAGGGSPRMADVPNLVVLKPYGGKLTPVEFRKDNATILDMVLLGGESISWK
jgi:hypothetical protein